MKPKVTHYVTVHYLSGPQVFRGPLGYCREIRASAIEDGTAVSGIKEIGPTPEPQSIGVEKLLQHMLDGSCTDNDCELHHMDVAADEEVLTDIHRAAWLAGVEWALNHDALRGYDNIADEILGEARTIATKGL